MNEKWFSLSVSDIEKKLKTNAALGLTHKAARSRFSARGGLLFEREPRGVLSLLASFFFDFLVIIFVALSVLALLFNEVATGGVCLVLTLLYLGLYLLVLYRNEKYFASADRATSPRCRVVRQGRLYSLSPRHVVIGDVILLRAGDVVPADARLITSDSLKVRMLFEKNKYILLDKLAEGAISPNENDPTRFSNIVHAGSVIVGGAARAIVVAIGNYTYAGAKIGRLSEVHSAVEAPPRLLQRLKKVQSLASISLLVASLPISILAMLFGGDTLSLFSVFMTVLAAAFLCASYLALTLYKIFYEIQAKRLVMARDAAVIRSPYSLDVLAAAKYVFLLDGGAVTDGIWHLDGICLADREYSEYMPSNMAAKRLSELADLYLESKKAGLSVGNETYSRYDDAIRELTKRLEVDRDALRIRCNVSGYIEKSTTTLADKVIFTDNGEKYVLSVSYTDDVIDECTRVCFENEVVCATDAFRYSAKATFKSYAEEGKKALILTVAKNEGYGIEAEKCFVGMIRFSEHTDGVAERAKKEIEARGVKVVTFKNIVTDSPYDSRLPESILGVRRADVRDFVATSKPLSHGLGNIDCYVGFTVRQIEELIAAIHERREQVVAVGVSDKFESIYRAADLTLTVSLDKFVYEPTENVVNVKVDPNETRAEAGAQSVLRIADAVVPRYTDGKGGLSSLLTAMRGASAAVNNIVGYFSYLVLINVVRVALVIAPMLLGAITVDARHLLLSGLITDMLALFAFARDKNTATGIYNRAMAMINAPIRVNKRAVAIFGGAALASGLIPILFSIIPSVPAYIDKVEYSFVSLMLFHVAAFLSSRLVLRGGRDRYTVVVPIVILTVLGISFFGGIANVLDVEGFASIVYFLLSFVAPVVAMAIFFLSKERKKKDNCK